MHRDMDLARNILKTAADCGAEGVRRRLITSQIVTAPKLVGESESCAKVGQAACACAALGVAARALAELVGEHVGVVLLQDLEVDARQVAPLV